MSADAEDDVTLLEEEMCALGAILGDDCQVNEEQRQLCAWIPTKDASPAYQLRVAFPSTGYPSMRPPQVDLAAPHLSDDMRERTEDELYDLFLPGEVRTPLCRSKYGTARLLEPQAVFRWLCST
jgi:hypothetical protein